MPPDVPPVDKPKGKHLAGCGQIHRRLELARAAHQVQMHCPDREPHHGRQRLPELAEIRCEQDIDAARGIRQPHVDRAQRRERATIQVRHQAWLVDLDPISAGRAELTQKLLVDRDERRPEVELLEPRVLGLAEQEERDGAEDDRPGRNAECLRLGELAERLGCVERELLGRLKLGNEVVVVRVEPLGHLERCNAGTLPLMGNAAGHREVAVKSPGDATESVGPDADHQGRVEHVVVQ